jgi:hypothetical protein
MMSSLTGSLNTEKTRLELGKGKRKNNKSRNGSLLPFLASSLPWMRALTNGIEGGKKSHPLLQEALDKRENLP